MEKKIFYAIVFFCFLHITAFTQDFCCGAIFTPQQAAILNQVNTLKEGERAPGFCLNKTLSIVAHIVLDSVKKSNMKVSDLYGAIGILNADFAPICLSFRICRIDTIENYKYDLLHSVQEGGEIKAIYNVPNMINMYLVQEVTDRGASYAPLPPKVDSTDFIVIQKKDLKSTKTVTHEMGHYMGLYHTFETSFGIERNDGSNCAVAGDLLCDTPPDGDPLNIDKVTCEYKDSSKDPAGNFLTPIIGNIMSYHPATCKCPFTIMQLNRMTEMYLKYRTYLY